MQVLAELAFVENAETLTSSRLVRVGSVQFRRFLEADARAALALFRDVCTRFCVAARNERSVLFDVPARLAALLLAYADIFGKPCAGGTRIRFALSQQVLADGLGIAVRSVRRVMAKWQEQDLVVCSNGRYVLKNHQVLQDMSAGLRCNLNYYLGIPVAHPGSASHG
jgi:CRP-like cAMP-binding protein